MNPYRCGPTPATQYDGQAPHPSINRLQRRRLAQTGGRFNRNPGTMSQHAVRIASTQGAATLSKGQKTFNRLIKKIEEQRKLLQAWQDMLPRFRAKHAAELAPALRAYNERREEFAYMLDKAHGGQGLTKTERTKLSDIIASVVSELLSSDETPELIALYDKHNAVAYAEEEQMAAESAKAMAQSLFGIELEDDAELNSPEDLAALVRKKLLEQQQQAEPFAPARPRKPSAKALAREAKAQEEAQHANQSIREVFRKLASALHPDRETDPDERARKTALMQRVNAAYEKNDLLGLLQLQLEVEQIDHADIAALSESRLKHYNKVLTEQAQELGDEIDFIESSFDDGDPFSRRRMHPALVLQWLDRDIAELKAATADVMHDLTALLDLKRLKAKLKSYRIQRDDDPFDDLHEFF